MDIVLYSTGCPKCKVLKNKLTDKGVNFIENNSVDDMLELNIMQAPVLSVDKVLMDFKEAVQWVNKQ